MHPEYGFKCFGKDYRLCFFEDGFRLYEVGAPSLSGEKHFPPFLEAKVEEGDPKIFSFGPYRLQISSDLEVVCYQGEEVLLSFAPNNEKQDRGDLSLMEKEGHDSAQLSAYPYGISILSSSPVYGLGERSGPLDKRGYDYICWNTDDPSAHVDTFKSLYQSIPFFILFRGKDSAGIFLDDTNKTHFDFNKSNPERVQIDYSGKLDLYIFFGSLPKVVADFSSLTGRNPLCPYWALGAQQSRWSYNGASEVDAVIEGYRNVDIPLSVVYLDIDYMDSYKDFTVDEKKFPSLKRWLAKKKEEGIRIVPIVDAGVKAEEGYFLYDEGIQGDDFSKLDGKVYHNEVWPGDSVFPAFVDPKVQSWWAKHISRFLDLGFAGIWNDMNEPASFKGPLPDEVEMGLGIPHKAAHNVYGHFMVKAGYEGFLLSNRRPFQLTRAGYAGTCAYANTWAGDNQSIYDHLRLSLPQMMNMSLSGQTYIGVDIGGFSGDTTPELLVRFAIGALLYPLYRNHSALGTLSQEPYRLKGEYLKAYRQAVLYRYELLPAIYDELYLGYTNGTAPIRPLIYNYPNDPRLINENTEIMLGENILLAPSLFPGQRKRAVYFPDEFVCYQTRKLYSKGDHLIDVGLLDIPLFFRVHGLTPLADKGSRDTKRGKTLRLYTAALEGYCLHYEDAGDGLGYLSGEYNLYSISYKEAKVSIECLHKGIESVYETVSVEMPQGTICSFPFEEVIQ